jgi:hypothetical protein
LFNCMVHLLSADMKTSHGEPAVICVYSALDPAELTIRWQLFAVSNADVMLATTLVRLEAMKILRFTAAGLGVGVGVGVIEVRVAVGELVAVEVGAVECVGVGLFVGVGLIVSVADGVGVGVGVGDELEFAENAPVYDM